MKKKKKKVKVKYKNILFIGIIVISLIVIPKIFNKKNDDKTLPDVSIEYLGKKIDELDSYVNANHLSLEKDYQYSEKYDKNYIIDIKKENDLIKATISLGIINDDVYREKGVNELGRVPIMMYHGIIDTEDNKYTGGNVDKDGYNRTSKAFKEDLEFYYNNGYRMIRLMDYVNGIVDVELGFSPIILTFDDGNKNNFNVLGRNSDGSLIIDPNCAVGILEDFKEKHPDMHVTATFFVMENFFNQKEYNKEILEYLVNHGYDVGNHTTVHANFTEINTTKTQEVVGKMYKKLDEVLSDKYVKILALPFGSPYKKTHENYPFILKGEYEGYEYETLAALRVGWEPELSPFDKDFDKTFLKRCRAYDNNGKEFDIESVFKNLEKNRYISDGDTKKIVIKKNDESKINKNYDNIVTY